MQALNSFIYLPYWGSTVSGGNGSLTSSAGDVTNVSMPTANTEYSYTFPSGTKKWCIRNRNTGMIKLSFALGQSGTQRFTIYSGEPFKSPPMDGTALTIYFQSPSASQILEVIKWS